ncbi:unnamed protein product [Pleuronectes platessa]|uniref:Uncharacterized protein n=1 Tax=Pleuronectes platessa TaxID=8262 RepID=A0A9N7UNF8_PLEPL|nr:unnamed protein product [Pleuronectes platessa]
MNHPVGGGGVGSEPGIDPQQHRTISDGRGEVPEVRRSGGQVVRRSGGQEVRWSGGQEVRWVALLTEPSAELQGRDTWIQLEQKHTTSHWSSDVTLFHCINSTSIH